MTLTPTRDGAFIDVERGLVDVEILVTSRAGGCRAGPASPGSIPGTRRSPRRPCLRGGHTTASAPSTCFAAAASIAVLVGSLTVGGTFR